MESKNTNPKKSQEIPRNIDLSKYDLNDTDKRVLLLKLNNVKQIDIAKQLKRKEATISNICNKPEFLKAYNELTAEKNKTYIQILIEAQIRAANRYTSFIDSINESLAARVCENILQFDKLELDDRGTEDNDLQFEGW